MNKKKEYWHEGIGTCAKNHLSFYSKQLLLLHRSAWCSREPAACGGLIASCSHALAPVPGPPRRYSNLWLRSGDHEVLTLRPSIAMTMFRCG